jgi:hypothetical protein
MTVVRLEDGTVVTVFSAGGGWYWSAISEDGQTARYSRRLPSAKQGDEATQAELYEMDQVEPVPDSAPPIVEPSTSDGLGFGEV